MKKALLSLNVQWDYITLRTPNGNFTRARYSSKASGKLCNNSKAFNDIENYINREIKKEGANMEKVMTSLTDPKVLETLWPEWNAPQTPPPALGDMVIAPVFKRNNPGKVMEIKKKYAYIKFPEEQGRVGIEFHHLQKA